MRVWYALLVSYGIIQLLWLCGNIFVCSIVPKYNQMFMIIEIIDKSLRWRTFIHQGYQIIWNQGQNNENMEIISRHLFLKIWRSTTTNFRYESLNENINKNQCILKQRSPRSIYTGIIKNTFGSYILKNYGKYTPKAVFLLLGYIYTKLFHKK
jgi:hypothetical protein